jgi:dolichyl-phosphate beta-glucosyltransferase
MGQTDDFRSSPALESVRALKREAHQVDAAVMAPRPPFDQGVGPGPSQAPLKRDSPSARSAVSAVALAVESATQVEQIDMAGFESALTTPAEHSGTSTRHDVPTATVELAVVIPMYRESERITASLLALSVNLLAERGVHLVLVDDGSDDATGATAAKALRQFDIRNANLLAAPVNKGKGAAVRLGVEYALDELRAEYVVYLDADLSLDPHIVLDALDRLRATKADAIVGTRLFAGGRKPLLRRLASTVFRQLATHIAPTGVDDTQCACKVFTANAAHVGFDALSTTGYAFDVEVLLRLRRAGLRIEEITVPWQHQPGSKISTARHAVEMTQELVRIRRVVG